MTVREWLRASGYEDIADMIDEVVAERQRDGSKERRNWWDVLAGGKDGNPHVIAGRTFPVLISAQKRQGVPITENAIQRSRNETVPNIKPMARWKKA